MSTKVKQQRITDDFKTQPVLKAWLFEHMAAQGDCPCVSKKVMAK